MAGSPATIAMKRKHDFISTFVLLGLLGGLAASRAADPAYRSWAPTPPMGWNSWDCFGAGVWQSNVLANAEYMAGNLKSHGWNIITIDIQKDFGTVTGSVTATVNSHGAVLLRVHPE